MLLTCVPKILKNEHCSQSQKAILSVVNWLIARDKSCTKII